VLCGLLKQIDPGLKSLNVEDAASLGRRWPNWPALSLLRMKMLGRRH